jgi:hypothetical protein
LSRRSLFRNKAALSSKPRCRPGPSLLGLDVTLARWSGAFHRAQEFTSHTLDLINCTGERGLIRASRFGAPAQFANELFCGRADLSLRSRRLEVEQRSYIAAHDINLTKSCINLP